MTSSPLDPNGTKKQIERLVRFLVELGFSDAQTFALRRDLGNGESEITFPAPQGVVSLALKNRSYAEIYQTLRDGTAFNVRMLDGALLQMMYRFGPDGLLRHRLAFFPSPHLEGFQSSPEVYLEDALFAEVVHKNIVPFPFRFDFNAADDDHEELHHPKAHLTLGQYRNCRIPVTAPLTPLQFGDFVLRNFYHTSTRRFAQRLPRDSRGFPPSIASAERRIIHVTVQADS